MSVTVLAWPPVCCNTRESQFYWHCYHTNENIRNKTSLGCKVETSVSFPALFLCPCMRNWLRRSTPFMPWEELTTYRCREGLFDCVEVKLNLNEEEISLKDCKVITNCEQFLFFQFPSLPLCPHINEWIHRKRKDGFLWFRYSFFKEVFCSQEDKTLAFSDQKKKQ